MSRVQTRAFVTPTAVETEDGRLVVADEEARELFERMLGTLLTLGGTYVVQAERVATGEVGGEVLATTVRLVGRYTGTSPLIELADLSADPERAPADAGSGE